MGKFSFLIVGVHCNINNVTYNLKQLILATSNFQKDDVDICYASTDKRTSVYVKNCCYLWLESDVAMTWRFEPGATISNSLVTSPYLSLSTGNVSSLYVYTNIIHSQYVGDFKVPLLRIAGVDDSMESLLQKHWIDVSTYLSVDKHWTLSK